MYHLIFLEDGLNQPQLFLCLLLQSHYISQQYHKLGCLKFLLEGQSDLLEREIPGDDDQGQFVQAGYEALPMHSKNQNRGILNIFSSKRMSIQTSQNIWTTISQP